MTFQRVLKSSQDFPHKDFSACLTKGLHSTALSQMILLTERSLESNVWQALIYTEKMCPVGRKAMLPNTDLLGLWTCWAQTKEPCVLSLRGDHSTRLLATWRGKLWGAPSWLWRERASPHGTVCSMDLISSLQKSMSASRVTDDVYLLTAKGRVRQTNSLCSGTQPVNPRAALITETAVGNSFGVRGWAGRSCEAQRCSDQGLPCHLGLHRPKGNVNFRNQQNLFSLE